MLYHLKEELPFQTSQEQQLCNELSALTSIAQSLTHGHAFVHYDSCAMNSDALWCGMVIF